MSNGAGKLSTSSWKQYALLRSTGVRVGGAECMVPPPTPSLGGCAHPRLRRLWLQAIRRTIWSLLTQSCIVTWCDNFKYLGISFRSGPRLYVDTDVTKTKFFTACNSIFGNCHSTDELIQLHLLESYCFPLLQYAMCALRLTATQRADLNSCWNSVYRCIFDFRNLILLLYLFVA